MPKIDFSDMPYEKKYSTGEHVRRNAFYLPDETIEESEEIYRGYYTIHYPVLTSGYCDNCPNNPSNGGSGICNCILGQPHIT